MIRDMIWNMRRLNGRGRLHLSLSRRHLPCLMNSPTIQSTSRPSTNTEHGPVMLHGIKTTNNKENFTIYLQLYIWYNIFLYPVMRRRISWMISFFKPFKLESHTTCWPFSFTPLTILDLLNVTIFEHSAQHGLIQPGANREGLANWPFHNGMPNNCFYFVVNMTTSTNWLLISPRIAPLW